MVQTFITGMSDMINTYQLCDNITKNTKQQLHNANIMQIFK